MKMGDSWTGGGGGIGVDDVKSEEGGKGGRMLKFAMDIFKHIFASLSGAPYSSIFLRIGKYAFTARKLFS